LDPPIQFSRYNGFGGAWYVATSVRNTWRVYSDPTKLLDSQYRATS